MLSGSPMPCSAFSMAVTAAPSEALWRKIERHGGGRKLRQMIDQQRARSPRRPWRSPRAAPGRRRPTARRWRRASRRTVCGRVRLQDDAILVRLSEDGGDDALTERIVQRVVDGADADAEARGAVAVDGDVGGKSVVFLIADDVGEFGLRRSAATSFGVHVDSAAESALSRVN